jgi:hypothetical protein
MALDIARRARVDVSPPRPADAVGAFDYRQVINSSAPQRYCRGKTAETGPDDHHPRAWAATGKRHDAA